MKLSVDDLYSHLYDIIDLDTDKRIPLVQWADDETGEYEVVLKDEKGNLRYVRKDNKTISVKELRKGNIKFIRKGSRFVIIYLKIKKVIRDLIRRGGN